MAWTRERVETLTNLWKMGKSASQIADELGEGVSRNAVIGKIHRLGLSERSGKTKDKTNLAQKKSPFSSLPPLDGLTNAEKGPSKHYKQTDMDVNPAKKRGRKPSQTSANKIQRTNGKVDKKNDLTKDNIEPVAELSGVSDLDKEALANMIEIEKKSKKLCLLELTERTCKWPIGDPATSEFWFCGHQAESGKPYCATHIAIAFQPISTRREKKQR